MRLLVPPLGSNSFLMAPATCRSPSGLTTCSTTFMLCCTAPTTDAATLISSSPTTLESHSQAASPYSLISSNPAVSLSTCTLMEAEGTSARVSFPVTGSRGVSKVRYTRSSGGSAGRVWINREQYFEGVDPEIWDFALCGYRPAQKWLKDRKDRVLSDDEIDHYRRIRLRPS